MFRLAQLRRTLISLLAVSLACAVYVVGIAPLIEAAPPSDAGVADPAAAAVAGTTSDAYVDELAELFKPGSWELDRPQVISGKRATILLSDFEQQGESLRIKKCSLVFYPKDAPRAKRRPVVLQAPEGAILDFDEPIDLRRGAFGRPVGGKLVGNIRIFRKGGPGEEDLELTTRNVVITDRRIWTPEPVTFRLGTNYGHGEYLIIERSQEEEEKAEDDWLAGLGRIELRRLHRFTLQVVGDDWFDAMAGPRRGHRPQADATAARIPTAVKLLCRGPLHFDLHTMMATVDEDVRITRQRPGMQADVPARPQTFAAALARGSSCCGGCDRGAGRDGVGRNEARRLPCDCGRKSGRGPDALGRSARGKPSARIRLRYEARASVWANGHRARAARTWRARAQRAARLAGQVHRLCGERRPHDVAAPRGWSGAVRRSPGPQTGRTLDGELDGIVGLRASTRRPSAVGRRRREAGQCGHRWSAGGPHRSDVGP